MRFNAVNLLISVIILLPPLDLHGTQTVVPEAATCASCEVVAVSAVPLGRGDDLSVPYCPIDIAEDSLGRFWVTFPYGEMPRVFRPDGGFVGVVGREGEGPQEFKAPVGVVALPGDSVAVLDPSNGRIPVVGSDLSVRRLISRLPPLSDLELISWPDSVLGMGIVYTPAAVGHPLHLVHLGGAEVRLIRSFGNDQGEFRPSHQYLLLRRLTPLEDGTYVEASVLDYSFSIRGRDGSPPIQFIRNPLWFSSTSNWSFGFYDRSPPPMINGVSRDSKGRIWVFLRRAVENWAAAWPDGLPPESRRSGWFSSACGELRVLSQWGG